MHSFIHSFNPPFSLYHSFTRTNQASPLPFITIYNHPSINHALHGPLSMAFVHARMTLPWLAHNGMHLHAYRLPTTTLQRYIHACMHACIEMTTSSHPLNVLMSICGGGGGGGDIDHRVGTAASLLLRVDSWMTDLKAMMVMRICVMIGRRMTYILYMYTQRQRTTGPKQKNKWDQDRSPITGNNHSKSIEESGMSQSRRYTWRAQPQRHALRYISQPSACFFKTYKC